MDIQKSAEELRKKAGVKKLGEKEIDTKQRMKEAVARRDEAIKKIEGFQDQTGIPQDDEIDGSFLTESGIDLDLDEFREKENEE